MYKWVGWVLIACSTIGLLGWIQSGDPDCILDTGVFAQLRMCDPDIVGEPRSWPAWSLVLLLAGLTIGVFCLRRARHGGAPQSG